MKNMKKFASILLALVLAMALTVPAFAEGATSDANTKGSITIDNAIQGETYTIYKIFDVTYSDAVADDKLTDAGTDWTSGKFSYKVTDAWKDFFATGAAGATYVTVTNDYVTATNMPDAAAVANFATAALKWARDNKIQDQGSKAAPKETGSAPDATTSVTFTGLDLGYYLVDSSTGTLCSLNTTAPNVTIREKNDIPSVDKQVQEDSKTTDPDGGWGKKNDAQIGDTVNFKSTVSLGKGVIKYVLHDKMGKGLTFNSNSIKVDGKELTAEIGTLKTTTTDGCTFELEFTDEYVASCATAGEIVVTYSAVLNDEADIYTLTNKNETWVNYDNGDNVTHDTPKSETETLTFKFEMVKTDGDGKPLTGAEFELYDVNEGGSPIQFVVGSDGTYRVATAEEITDNTITKTTKIVVSTEGFATVAGLDGDKETSYYLQETKAPEGYNLLVGRQEVKLYKEDTGAGDNIIRADKDGDGNFKAGVDTGVIVVNNAGVQMPETGGIGTTIFYTLGGLMVVAAGVLLVTKRRMHSNG